MKSQQGQIFSLALILMAGTAGFLLWLRSIQQVGRPGVSLELPAQVLDYQSVPLKISDGELNTLPKDTSFARRLYTRAQGNITNFIQLSIVLMGKDRTSIHKPQLCLVGQGWTIRQSESKTIPIELPFPYTLPVMKLTGSKTVRLEDGRMVPMSGLYVYWFVADHSLTSSHWQRMWQMAKQLVCTGVLQRWAYVSCFTVCAPGQEQSAYEEVCRFASAATPAFQLATGNRIALNKGSPQVNPAHPKAAVEAMAVAH